MDSSARAAYDVLAAGYDRFTASYEHARWLAALLELAAAAGLTGERVLDVACGTGKSAAPLLDRGWAVAACDLSPAMVEIARRRLGPGVDVFVADMRALAPARGPFDLVTCLDDALNYLAGEADLAATFAGVARVLAPGGLFVFDVNTLGGYDRAFCSEFVVENGGALFCWRGERPATLTDGGRFRARLDAFERERDGRWIRSAGIHEQRHFGAPTIRRRLEAAGLEVVRVLGQTLEARIDPGFDERVHVKRVTLARRPPGAQPGDSASSDAGPSCRSASRAAPATTRS